MGEDSRSIKVFLFRLVLEPNAKRASLAEISIKRHDLLAKLIKLSPQYKFSEQQAYLTSKVSEINSKGLYFKFGVQALKKGVSFDESQKDFIESPKSDTDYAHCLFDINHQLLAIESKSKLVSPKSLANKLATTIENMRHDDKYNSLMTPEEIMLLANSTCKSRIVYEASEFISKLRSAYRVNSFKIAMLLPNPFDFEDALGKPLEKYMEETGASGSALTIKNVKDGLDVDRLIPISRDIGAYGAGAEAKIVDSETSNPLTIVLNKSENHAYVELTLPETMFTVNFIDNAKHFLNIVLEKYRKIHENKKE